MNTFDACVDLKPGQKMLVDGVGFMTKNAARMTEQYVNSRRTDGRRIRIRLRGARAEVTVEN